MSTARRTGVLLALGLVSLLLWAAPASAHAVLESSTPADGSTIDAAPEDVVLRFTEPVSLSGGGVDVLDGAGQAIDAGDAEVDGPLITVPMPDELADGTYVISYRITSADGHPISGGIVFGLGVAPDAGAGAAAAQPVDEGAWGYVAGVGRLLGYAGALVAAGAALFLAVVADPELPRRPFRWVVPVAAVAAVVAVPVLVVSQAARVSGRGWDVVSDEEQLRSALGQGLGWQCLLLVLAVASAVASARSTGTIARVGAVLSLILTGAAFAIWGHARTGEPSWLALGGDALHVAAGAAWVGGLALLAWVLLGRIGDSDAAARTVARFSSLAGVFVIAVALGGSALAFAELRSVSALWDTDYGRLLLVKLAVVGVVLALAGWNRFRLVPRVEAAAASGPGAALRDGGWRPLRTSVGLEAAGLLLILGVTTVLVEVTPAVTDTVAGDAPAPAAPFHGEAAVGEAELSFEVTPGAAGANDVHLTYLGADGALADIAEEVTLEFRLPEADLGPISRDTVELVGGHYTYSGTDLSIPGEWEVTVVTRLSRFEEERTPFTVPIGA
jgi:copper transport protein